MRLAGNLLAWSDTQPAGGAVTSQRIIANYFKTVNSKVGKRHDVALKKNSQSSRLILSRLVNSGHRLIPGDVYVGGET